MAELERIKRERDERLYARKYRVAELGLEGLEELAQQAETQVDELIAMVEAKTHELNTSAAAWQRDIEKRDQARADVKKLRAFVSQLDMGLSWDGQEKLLAETDREEYR